MAIEVLLGSPFHRVRHDLESVFYALLFICTHLNGPLGEIQNPPLYGNNKKDKHSSPMTLWFDSSESLHSKRLEKIGYLKSAQIITYFYKDCSIMNHISPYFSPLKKYIEDIRDALFTDHGSKESATPHDVIKIFKAVLLDDKLIDGAKEAYDSNIYHKRSHPGDFITPDCWDPVKAEESIGRTSKKPKLTSTRVTRSAALLTKGLKNTKNT